MLLKWTCGTWIGPTLATCTLMMSCPQCRRSQGSTKRSYFRPEGGNSKAVRLANVLVMRILYLYHGCKMSHMCVSSLECLSCATYNWCYQLSLFYAHQRGVYWLIEQPMTSVRDFIWFHVRSNKWQCATCKWFPLARSYSCGTRFRGWCTGATPGLFNTCCFFILNIGSVCIHELSWKESDFPNGCIRQSHYENDSVAFGCKECHGGNWSYSTWTSDSATHQHYPSFFRVYKYKRKWLTFVIRYPWKASYDVGHFLGYHTSPRLAGTLPLMHGLRRALDWKQLKKALERTGAVIWTSCLFPTCSGNVIYVCFELALGNKRKRAKWNWSRYQWVRMVSVGLYLGSTNSEPCISVTQCK